jgi:5-methylcytosine-specific restriction endonuclease McrA
MVRTARGDRQVSPAVLAAILCDADIREPGQRLRAAVTPRLRRKILTRDGYRCRSAGCTSTHFLDVHHRVKNGCNDPSNLITLCDACHVAVHRLELLRRRGHASNRA